ncbi:DUF4123 domain-containing protein [Symbiopectobacterium purcellii]|uniref:DUF4123 domain-containing protein n=1 Tax=Symbiopectobacterium purcellii TaxID=2871826 RepID=A0ABX9AJE4_9ENTR|nr:DUF4123 domain-containing protein [Symbiopectobacterium purcellii]QZN94191.1 DUF4123 domain-containing protein [Symbiopectobacterium purcellii]
MTNGFTLFDISQRAAPLYAVISLLDYPELPEYWQAFQLAAAGVWRQLQFTPRAEAWQRWAPLVVQIEEGKAGETLVHWLEETAAAGHGGVTLFSGPLTLQQAAELWQQRISCLWPEGTVAIFRSDAPAVLFGWWHTLDALAQRAFLGPMTQLYLPVIDDKRCYRLLAQQDTPATVHADTFYQIQLTPEQYALLAHDNRLHRLANELFLYASTLTAFPLDIEVVKQRFLSGIVLAKQVYPLAGEAECEAWSVHRWVLGSEFYHHPAFISLTEHHTLADSLRIFKSAPEHLHCVRLHYHRPGWMRGDLPDISEVAL